MQYLVTKNCLHGVLRFRKDSVLTEDLQKNIEPFVLSDLVKRGILVAMNQEKLAKKKESKKTEGIAPVIKPTAIPMWGFNPADLMNYSVEELNAIILDTMEKASMLEEYQRNQLIYLYTDKDAAIAFMSQHFASVS